MVTEYPEGKNKYQAFNIYKKRSLDFFKEYPEEKRGRKNFKKKEVQNVKALIYEEIFQKAIAIKADCIGSIKENVSKSELQDSTHEMLNLLSNNGCDLILL